MGKIFFTADLHIGHKNIIRYDSRPFSSVEEMDEYIIKKWNNKVTDDDLVYVLGDFIWSVREKDAAGIINSLNGRKILIKGNHDTFVKIKAARDCLEDVKDYDRIWVRLENGQKRRCILSHYFMPFYNGHFRGVIHLHGHSHESKESIEELKIAKYLNEHGFPNRIFNVGCMKWNYEPVTLDEILSTEETNN